MGVDGVTKETYGENLSENLDDLLKRMKQFSYKPYPVRRAYIPKGKRADPRDLKKISKGACHNEPAPLLFDFFQNHRFLDLL